METVLYGDGALWRRCSMETVLYCSMELGLGCFSSLDLGTSPHWIVSKRFESTCYNPTILCPKNPNIMKTRDHL